MMTIVHMYIKFYLVQNDFIYQTSILRCSNNISQRWCI